MAITVADFKVAFPEFAAAPVDLITAKLAMGARLAPAAVWGTFAEDGAFHYCARFLALSPFGRKIALVTKTGVTIYDEEIRRLKYCVTNGSRVL